MKLIEHLEYIIGLIGKASPAEIKGQLIAIREEVAGNEAAAANQVKLAEEKAKVDAENSALKAEIARRDFDDAAGGAGTAEVFHKGIKFKRGPSTRGLWTPFCPKCGLPVNDVTTPTGNGRLAMCSAHCGWVGVELDLQGGMDSFIAEIST